MTGATPALLGAAAVGSGVMAGVLGAFSGFVMPALGRLPEGGGAAAMRAINTAAVRPPLMITLFGTAAASIAAAGAVLVQRPDVGSVVLTLAGTGSYLAGVLGVTALANVPLNDRLAASTDPYWAAYRRRWTRWNHLRTGAALVSAAAFTVAVAG